MRGNPPSKSSFRGSVMPLSFRRRSMVKKAVAWLPARAERKAIYRSLAGIWFQEVADMDTLSIVGSICSVIGLVFAIYVYVKSKNKKKWAVCCNRWLTILGLNPLNLSIIWLWQPSGFPHLYYIQAYAWSQFCKIRKIIHNFTKTKKKRHFLSNYSLKNNQKR